MYTRVWLNFLNVAFLKSNMMIVRRMGGKKVNNSLEMLMVRVLRTSFNISEFPNIYL